MRTLFLLRIRFFLPVLLLIGHAPFSENGKKNIYKLYVYKKGKSKAFLFQRDFAIIQRLYDFEKMYITKYDMK